VEGWAEYTPCLKKVCHFCFHNNFGTSGPIFFIIFTYVSQGNVATDLMEGGGVVSAALRVGGNGK